MIQPSSTKRILHVDQHPVANIGLRHLLKSLPNTDVVYAEDLASLDHSQCAFDLVIVELVATPPLGVAAIREILSAQRGVPILVLSSNDEAIYADRCLKAGARGYVMKTAALDEIREAVESVSEGSLWVSDNVKALMVNRLATPIAETQETGFHHLSDRELLIVEQIALSKNNKEIAQALQISVKTIESHRSRIKTKLRLATPQDLMRYALRIHGI